MTTEDPDRFDPIPVALQAIAEGRLVIVTDDADRENEGDLILAGAKVTPQAIQTMIRHGSGIVCVPMADALLRRLGIGRMVAENRESHRTDFTVSVDAAEGITTGISAFDRAETIRLLADPATRPDQLVQPGHVFPLRAKPGGVLQRAGHTEAAVDLAVLAGLPPVGVIVELMNDDGTVMRLPELQAFRRRFGLPMISIADLIEYRHRSDRLVVEVAREEVDTPWGPFHLHHFRNVLDGRVHHAFVRGEVDEAPLLVRVHREDRLADLFGVGDAARSGVLAGAMAAVAREGRGVVLYLGRPDGGRRIPMSPPAAGAAAGAASPAAAEPMNLRDYGIGAQVLAALGARRLRLLTSSHRRIVGLDGYGLEVVDQIPLTPAEHEGQSDRLP